MDLDKIYQLMDKFEQSNLTSFEYRDQEFEIQLGKKSKAAVANGPVVTPAPATPQPAPIPNVPASEAPVVTPQPTVTTPVASMAEPTPVSAAPVADEIDPKECVTAPVVGIYYPAHSAEEPPYVKVGDHVSVGQQVGLIQAMQMMRPVVAKQAGQVKRILVQNGDEVNFGQPLIQLALDNPSDI